MSQEPSSSNTSKFDEIDAKIAEVKAALKKESVSLKTLKRKNSLEFLTNPRTTFDGIIKFYSGNDELRLSSEGKKVLKHLKTVFNNTKPNNELDGIKCAMPQTKARFERLLQYISQLKTNDGTLADEIKRRRQKAMDQSREILVEIERKIMALPEMKKKGMGILAQLHSVNRREQSLDEEDRKCKECETEILRVQGYLQNIKQLKTELKGHHSFVIVRQQRINLPSTVEAYYKTFMSELRAIREKLSQFTKSGSKDPSVKKLHEYLGEYLRETDFLVTYYMNIAETYRLGMFHLFQKILTVLPESEKMLDEWGDIAYYLETNNLVTTAINALDIVIEDCPRLLPEPRQFIKEREIVLNFAALGIK